MIPETSARHALREAIEDNITKPARLPYITTDQIIAVEERLSELGFRIAAKKKKNMLQKRRLGHPTGDSLGKGL